MTNLRNALLTIALAILPGTVCRAASIAINFDAPTLIAEPGQTVNFSGTLTNLTPFVVDLNGCAASISGFTTDDCALFFANAPFTLNPNETSFDFDMFSVTVDSSYSGPFGLQPSGVLTIIGALELPTGTLPDTNIGEQDFQLSVAPEPGTAALLALALPVAFALRRRADRRW